ncbi:5-oxoprolinase subunit PxpB [Virgibacillus halodenitrificans]|uniref:5-oxoprolinase subunit PxpB n=1 Tax=Virgibacillus halodenitrificans TaxID=1482 RepID=UPI001FB2750A|nr:5-oxoprolinase subunit PxpB [Virgibacillus halodenitrificans]MCJ0932613.1 5-oxoprolinase subunit PxpB [Virgibacillus halodenitrificans]
MNFTIDPVGDTGIRISFNENVSSKLIYKIKMFCNYLENMGNDAIIELVPAFDSITLYYKPYVSTYKQLSTQIKQLEDIPLHKENVISRRLTIPVLYGGEWGPDLERVANQNALTVSKVIELHQKPNYLVYMLGFLPGFPYLGGLEQKLATPRLDKPRDRTPPGSIGIAYEQTGIYPLESPGGWNIIGKTPITLFDIYNKGDEFLFRAGDYVKFEEVTAMEFSSIEEKIVEETYKLKIEEEFYE